MPPRYGILDAEPWPAPRRTMGLGTASMPSTARSAASCAARSVVLSSSAVGLRPPCATLAWRTAALYVSTYVLAGLRDPVDDGVAAGLDGAEPVSLGQLGFAALRVVEEGAGIAEEGGTWARERGRRPRLLVARTVPGRREGLELAVHGQLFQLATLAAEANGDAGGVAAGAGVDRHQDRLEGEAVRSLDGRRVREEVRHVLAVDHDSRVVMRVGGAGANVAARQGAAAGNRGDAGGRARGLGVRRRRRCRGRGLDVPMPGKFGQRSAERVAYGPRARRRAGRAVAARHRMV
ncbi:hypothetical protein DFJ74DRAFT_672474 [Hyaloraphidium curvatum]|nr:hypothetical protein DFJ74DRAFT_672474 [Hyaloraphidium curvatum]